MGAPQAESDVDIVHIFIVPDRQLFDRALSAVANIGLRLQRSVTHGSRDGESAGLMSSSLIATLSGAVSSSEIIALSSSASEHLAIVLKALALASAIALK